jgi:hypothetical protein
MPHRYPGSDFDLQQDGTARRAVWIYLVLLFAAHLLARFLNR